MSFGAFNFFQKSNENKSTWGIIVVKTNLFVRYLFGRNVSKLGAKLHWELEQQAPSFGFILVSNSCWKFQLSILINKKVSILKKILFKPLLISKQKSFVYWLRDCFQGRFWLGGSRNGNLFLLSIKNDNMLLSLSRWIKKFQNIIT